MLIQRGRVKMGPNVEGEWKGLEVLSLGEESIKCDGLRWASSARNARGQVHARGEEMTAC